MSPNAYNRAQSNRKYICGICGMSTRSTCKSDSGDNQRNHHVSKQDPGDNVKDMILICVICWWSIRNRNWIFETVLGGCRKWDNYRVWLNDDWDTRYCRRNWPEAQATCNKFWNKLHHKSNPGIKCNSRSNSTSRMMRWWRKEYKMSTIKSK